jgi:hypothetical protein
MKVKSMRINAIIIAIAAVITVIAACKKENPQKETAPAFTQMPDSAMFVSTFDANSATTIYVLNAATGSVSAQYTYPATPYTTWSYPAAGNGFLYSLENNKINAINMNTGAITWTDAVDNVSIPVLHDNTFYGVYQLNTSSYGVYALDATKPTKDYLWKYPTTGTPSEIKYYKGTLYVMLDQQHLAALDAQTGALKWSIGNGPYALGALNDGVIIAGKTVIDADSGTEMGTVNPPVIPPTYTNNSETSALSSATSELYYVSTDHFNSSDFTATKYITAINRTTGTTKWQFKYDGGWASSWGITNTITQIWNKNLILKYQANSSSKYGTTTAESYWIMDGNTGTVKLRFEDAYKGATVSNYIAGNTMYFDKRNVSTLHGLPFGSDFPPANFLFAIDLATGKQKWNNDKLLEGYTGTAYSCVYTGGKGFSPFIQ